MARVPAPPPGDTLGILKFNADTSDAEEGISSSDLDGHLWAGGDVSPWKLDVSADDYVYVDDMANGGDVYRWDPTISSNSILHVLRQDNQLHGAELSGPAIIGTGTNTQVWMVDTNTAIIRKWLVNSNSVCTSNDTGVIVAANAAAANFFHIALDTNGNMYTSTYLTQSGNPSPRVFRYRAYDPSTNGNMPEATSDWAVGGGNDTYAGASGVAVDPTGTYLAVAFEGPAGGFSTNGNTKILWATNGALAANLDLGVAMQGDATHDDTACAWDAAGNVYYTDIYFGRWRAFSPPGTNQATTVALATIQMINSAPPFTILTSSTVNGSYANASNATVTQISPGVYQASLPVNGLAQYYRVERVGAPPGTTLLISRITVASGIVNLVFSVGTK